MFVYSSKCCIGLLIDCMYRIYLWARMANEEQSNDWTHCKKKKISILSKKHIFFKIREESTSKVRLFHPIQIDLSQFRNLTECSEKNILEYNLYGKHLS